MTKEELLTRTDLVHVLGYSGGKDSGAAYCEALDALGPTGFRVVAADTDNENEHTYRQWDLISEVTGGPKVERVKANFEQRIRAKAEYVRRFWPGKLLAGVPGKWEWRSSPAHKAKMKVWFREKRKGNLLPKPEKPEPPPLPADVFGGYPSMVNDDGRWVWIRGHRPRTQAEVDEIIATALTFLVPTGNAFLDLCIWKGRFPSRKAQFCTQELKVAAIDEFVTRPLLAAGHTVISWQGVRANESIERRDLPEIQRLVAHDDLPGELWAYRPMLRIESVDEVFAIAERKGVPRNPLYDLGLKRVGCFPCINAGKDELVLMERHFPERIDLLEAWELHVSKCSKWGRTTFFNIVNDPVMQEEMIYAELLGQEYEISPETHGIRRMVQWAKTSRGGRQLGLFASEPEALACNAWGVCE